MGYGVARLVVEFLNHTCPGVVRLHLQTAIKKQTWKNLQFKQVIKRPVLILISDQ